VQISLVVSMAVLPLMYLTSLLHFWSQTLDRGGSVHASFVYFSEAFDRVDHNVIASKLIDRGVRHCVSSAGSVLT